MCDGATTSLLAERVDCEDAGRLGGWERATTPSLMSRYLRMVGVRGVVKLVVCKMFALYR